VDGEKKKKERKKKEYYSPRDRQNHSKNTAGTVWLTPSFSSSFSVLTPRPLFVFFPTGFYVLLFMFQVLL